MLHGSWSARLFSEGCCSVVYVGLARSSGTDTHLGSHVSTCNPFVRFLCPVHAFAQAGLPGSFMLTTEGFSNVALAQQTTLAQRTRPGTASTSTFPSLPSTLVGAATVLSALSYLSAEMLHLLDNTVPTKIRIENRLDRSAGQSGY